MTAASYQTTDNTADGIAHVTCPGRFTSPEVKTNQKNLLCADFTEYQGNWWAPVKRAGVLSAVDYSAQTEIWRLD